MQKFLEPGPKNFDSIQKHMKMDRTALRNMLNELDGAILQEYQGYGREKLFQNIREDEIDVAKQESIELKKQGILFEMTSFQARKNLILKLDEYLKIYDKLNQDQKHRFNYKVITLYLVCLFEQLDHSMFAAREKDFALMNSDIKHWQKEKWSIFELVNKLIDSMEESHKNAVLTEIQTLKKSKSYDEIGKMYEKACNLDY